ncbi:hypothetical protein DOTSEDRAFT_73990 [Dothistroma septosporum NZE10]|uniref:Altered inheritance of mitochondria protein 21 n=1 Tax=Dothistroma septosporum (strain NZE10 / CBS 128990) TaxID=675120 RepID=N1PHD5_DOTSN|nr:hypothetical protein DOTSEDRAFT_73990 [Dothistroma septosporum NZE10]
MSTPNVPPRPQRTQAGQAAPKSDLPSIPPRPSRTNERSQSRESYARSPLYGPPVSLGSKPVQPASGRLSAELPRRPPSVSLPSVGAEGDEYSSFDQLPPEAHGVSAETADLGGANGEQTKNVSADLPMHQPKASVPQSTAKRQIENVTGTDSTQAAGLGIGRSKPADDVHKLPPGDLGTSSSLSRVTSHTNAGQGTRRAPSIDQSRSTPNLALERTTSRPGSIFGEEDEHGIPAIGQQVPLLAMAGDVQAPSPGPGHSQHAPGIGFFNDGSTRAHNRKRSSRHEFGPPDSYGIRHDHENQDQFEKEWVRKHPHEAMREGNLLHLYRPETALSSEQLNRLVHSDSATAATPGTPDEHEAEEYLERASSTAPDHPKRASNDLHEPTSPHRKAGFPFNEKSLLHPDDAVEADAPRRSSRSYGYDSDHEHEHTDGTPILASDEIMKRPSSAFMHAAVTPDPDHNVDDGYYYDSDTANSRRGSHSNSRPSSRPASVHGAGAMQAYSGGSLRRFVSREEEHHSGMGTPLEEIEEYEPLFPEDEKNRDSPKKLFKKRPELAQHHFPSQDVWEDTPSSLQYSTTVSTPDLERRREEMDAARQAQTAATFETPEEEQNRRRQAEQEHGMTSDTKTFVKPHFKPGVASELHRPSTHRFPSSDVWEDSPDSYSLVNTTTVSASQEELRSPPGDDDDRPQIPARPQRSAKRTEEVSPADIRSPPSPEKVKPVIPARPQRTSRSDETDGVDATISREAPPVKAKPPVPARPGGEKISALKAGFMSDLNNRLKLGPQAPPKKESEPEAEEEPKAPLADARKSRARGPARRAPAKSAVADRKSSVAFAFSPLIHCWSIDESDELNVQKEEEHHDETNKENVPEDEPETGREAPEAEKALTQNEHNNTDSAAPAEDIAKQISSSEQPWKVAREHRGSESELKAALAAAGAAPRSFSNSDEKGTAMPGGLPSVNEAFNASQSDELAVAEETLEEERER